MPRFSKRRMRTRRTRRTRRTKGTGRSRRGGVGDGRNLNDVNWGEFAKRTPENDTTFEPYNKNPYAHLLPVKGGETERKMGTSGTETSGTETSGTETSGTGGEVKVGDAFMYKNPDTNTVQKLTVNEITGTDCWFNDNNGVKKKIDCDKLKKNSVNPKQALANLQAFNRGIDIDGYVQPFNSKDTYYKNGQYIPGFMYPRKNGGSKRIKRRKTQKRRRR